MYIHLPFFRDDWSHQFADHDGAGGVRPRVFIGAALAARCLRLPPSLLSPFQAWSGDRFAAAAAAARRRTIRIENEKRAHKFSHKDISSQINIHIKGDNKMLDELDTSFDATGGLLGGVTKRLNVVQRWGNMCYLAMFVVAVFLILWRMTKG